MRKEHPIIIFFVKILKRTFTLPIYVIDRLMDGVLYISAMIGRRTTHQRLSKGCPRTLWGVTPLLTLPIKARCDRMLGLESDSLVLTTYHVSSTFDINLSGITNFVSRYVPFLMRIWCKLVLFWALLRYDIFHYFYDRGILRPENPKEPDQKLMVGITEQELMLLERAGKRLYCFTYGADVRTRKITQALGKYNCCMDCPDPGLYCICSEAGARKNLDRIRSRARVLLATTDNVNDVEDARIFHYWALDLNKIKYVGVTRTAGPLIIAHAPNHPHFKGTRFLEAAVAQLRAEGQEVELRMVTGVTNEKVLEIFAEADIIADQFITGGYGYTLLEGLARGKPVLCFLRDPNWIAAPEECPVIQTDPDRLVETLRWCIAHRADLPELGRSGRRYVEQYYSIPAVASRLGELYLETGDFPLRVKDRLRSGIASTNCELKALLMAGNSISTEERQSRNV
jgi:hypothetical protein